MTIPEERAKQKKAVIRRKLLGVLPRAKLEELSGMDNPWRADRKTLTEAAVSLWDHDEVSASLNGLLIYASVSAS